ncbi:MAG TPA: zinc-dependent metalloprotease family protein [Rhodothermales bacterium]|nr:zinc-dependent metalloprotease family protein [Rhodothermales bacterium]
MSYVPHEEAFMIRFAGTCALALLLAILLIPDATLGQSLIRDDDPKQPGIELGQTIADGQRTRYVRLDPTALAESTVILRLFDDANYRAQRKGGRRHQQTDVWVGEIENEPMSSVIVSLHESGVLFGKIEVGSRSFFIKHFSGPVYAVIERDPDLPEDNEAVGDDFIILGDEAIQGDDDFGPEGDQDLQLGKLDADSACLPTTSCGPQVIDIMVVYTAAARGALGGTDPLAEAAIATAVAEMNTGLSNAGVSHSFNLVFTGEVSYAESGDASTDLTRLRNTSDGFMDIVHDMRDAYGADLVSLITDTGGCGIGYVPSTPTNLTPTSGFSVVRDDCLTGNKTLAHEVGHNMGLHHDWYVNNSTTPCEWHHGYVNQAAFGGTSSQRWRTLMAYNNQCAASGFNCTRLTYYSNPSNTYNGDPMGVAQGNPNPADNAFGLERTACQIANHRSPHRPSVASLLRDDKGGLYEDVRARSHG